jgi:hypothetical protein
MCKYNFNGALISNINKYFNIYNIYQNKLKFIKKEKKRKVYT